uniref:Uncharacterized protein n=1 Tax=Arundo donax TaxID=35708 RepID=A0A0A9BBG4_ARUDO
MVAIHALRDMIKLLPCWWWRM